MELNSQIEDDIRRLNDSNTLSEKQYEQFLTKIFSLFQTDKSEIQLDPSFDKRLVSSVLTFLFECVKYDFDETSLRSKLDELQLTNKIRQDRFVALYQQFFPTIQLYLKRNSLEHDRLLDVNWRLDFQLKTNHTEKLFEPIYILDWSKREKYTKQIEHFQISSSQADLQELVEKLKDAQSVLHQMQYQQQSKK